MGVAMHFLEIISLESQKMLTSAFFQKRRKGYFSTDFLRIRPYKQKSKHIYKDFKTTWYMVTKNHFSYAFNKSLQQHF